VRRLIVLLAALCVGAVPAAGSGTASPPDPIAEQLFPPELVMQHQQSIRLGDAQRRSITAAISSLQSRVLEMQWDMQARQQKLTELLGQNPVNEAAALAQADRLMESERQVKRAHLAALIKIKNVLTQEQQRKLRALAARGDDK
jgi:Spy/CpxP family protein refolding chaperone